MSRIIWDKTGQRTFETGVDHGVAYPLKGGRYQKGEAWNGLTAVNESSSGAEATPLYADNIKYLNLMSAEEYKATIEAYTYPDCFSGCIGEAALAKGVVLGQQKRQHFGFSFRTKCGNDENGTDDGYKLHLIFDCLASPSDRGHSTMNDSPEAMTYSWEISTTPVEAEGYAPTASLVLSSKRFKEKGITNVLKRIESILYGGNNLFDKNNAEIVRLYPKGDGGLNGRATTGSISWSLVVPVKPSTTYCFSMEHPANTDYRNRMNIGGYADYPQDGTEATFFDTTYTREGNIVYNVFTTTADTRYLLIFLWSDSKYTETLVRSIIDVSKMQLEEGSYRTEYADYADSEPRMPKISEIIELFELEMYVRDSENEALLDSAGHKIQSRVF